MKKFNKLFALVAMTVMLSLSSMSIFAATTVDETEVSIAKNLESNIDIAPPEYIMVFEFDLKIMQYTGIHLKVI